MYHFYDVVINDKTGVPLSNVIIRIYDDAGVIVPLFADENGSTPIEAVSGLANAAVTDGEGNYDFYIADGTYDIRFFVGDAVLKVLQNIQMVVAASDLDVQGKAQAAALGVTGSAVNMGTFTGTTIPDNQTAKQALQALETVAEAGGFFLQAGAGAVVQTGQAKDRQIRSIQDFGGVVDGATNDRAALALADAQGSARINGIARINSSITLANLPDVTEDGGFYLDTGVVLTVPPGFTAPLQRIFFGPGTVAGLTETWLEWFDGDSVTFAPTLPSVNVRPLIQKAINATIVGGVVRASYGQRAIDGAFIDLAGRSFQGAGYSAQGTVFYWNGAGRNGFRLNGAYLGGFVRGVKFDCLNASVPPTSGIALYTSQSETVFEDIETTGAYYGAYFQNMVIGRSNNVRHNDALSSPVLIEDSLDVFVDKWNHSALADLVTMTGTPSGGAFVIGESVSCATGSTGIVRAAYTNTIYKIEWNGIRPPVGGTVTATGKSATVSTVVVSHQLGSFRFVSTTTLCEGNSIGDGDSVGGEYNLVFAGDGTRGRHVGNCGDITIAPGAMFDVSYKGSRIDGGYTLSLYGRYASSRDVDASGVSMVNCSHVTGEPRCVNNAGPGIIWDASSEEVHLKSHMDGNCRNYTGATLAEIHVTGNAKKWSIIGGTAGRPGLNGGPNPPASIFIPGVGADEFSIIGVSLPLDSILIASTGTHVTILCPNIAPRISVGNLANVADNAAAITAGVQLGGFYRTTDALKVRHT